VISTHSSVTEIIEKGGDFVGRKGGGGRLEGAQILGKGRG